MNKQKLMINYPLPIWKAILHAPTTETCCRTERIIIFMTPDICPSSNSWQTHASPGKKRGAQGMEFKQTIINQCINQACYISLKRTINSSIQSSVCVWEAHTWFVTFGAKGEMEKRKEPFKYHTTHDYCQGQ